MDGTKWDILQKLRNFQNLKSDFAVLVLNQPIICDPQLINALWKNAAIRALADGGSNRWLDYSKKFPVSGAKQPDFISGDFDSIKPETRKHFEGLKVKFIHTPDQDETDFTKALRCVADFSKAQKINIKFVFVICENSGRFDQIIANINTLMKSPEILESIHVILISSECATWILHPGKHTIFVFDDFIKKHYPCGLIPLCGSAVVTTKGLKWDLDNHTMEMGGLVSTSNTYSGTEIFIICDKPIVWTSQYSDFTQ